MVVAIAVAAAFLREGRLSPRSSHPRHLQHKLPLRRGGAAVASRWRSRRDLHPCRRRRPWPCRPVVWDPPPPTYPFAYLKPPSRNPHREPRYGKPSETRAASTISGIQEIASGTLPRGFISGGLFIAMIASE
ncbi:hypothetical protein QYE76_031317 [Lolium multiflorum]|uniref:Uncharacterized protein n=1 Tax=Lolium multiflorum TaxID=4521 RepID=A0AAD8QTB1_LOLMU|nr:hypothetical protein QYE76_031317 [Lolium multiflorum]